MKWLGKVDLTRTSVQLASEGRWEDAVPADRTDPDALRRWLVEAGPNVAIESVYCDEAGNLKGFFGFRRVIEIADQRLSFWQNVVTASAPYQSQAPGEQLAAWLALLDVPSLLNLEPSGTQLGVFNQWLSAGPVTLHGNKLEREDVNSGPAWIRDGATAPICREQSWLAPVRVWVAETASSDNNGCYRIEPSLLPS